MAALERAAATAPWPILVAGCSTAPAGKAHHLRNVVALGDLDAHELAHELSRASIYALPARYEPFGLSILEAALAGCALVVGDIPSLREVWGRTALYVAPDDDVALRRCLQRLIDDEALRRCLGRAARARALTFTPERQASAYVEVYSAALATGRAEQQARIGRFDTRGWRACAS
jgi:glycosyltransferase involved in cell wall biosynthesis